MKLQKYKRRINKKVYHQYMITIPSALVKALKLEGKDLDWQLNKAGRLELVEKKRLRVLVE